MLPTELITGPLAVATGMICLLLVLLGAFARHRRRATPLDSVPAGSAFSRREKARMLAATQAFLFGVACSCFGVILFVLHERTAWNARASHSPQTSATITGTVATSPQQVR